MVIRVIHAKKAVALILALAFSLGAASCKKKKEDPEKDLNAWFDSKTIDIELPYNEADYNQLSSSFVGIVKDKAIVHVNYSKPYPNDFDYEHDDPSPYQGDTFEIYDLEGRHQKTYNLRNIGIKSEGLGNMQCEPRVSGDYVVIPWDYFDGKNGTRFTAVFFDPEAGKVINSYEKQLSSAYLTNYACSGGYGVFAFGKYDINCMEMDIVYEGKLSKTISFTNADINWQTTFPMLDMGDAKILLPYMKSASTSWGIDGYFIIDLRTATYEKFEEDLNWLCNTTTIYNASYVGDTGMTIADEDGLNLVDFAGKKLERLLNYDRCNANLYLLSRLKLYSSENDRYVFGGSVYRENYVDNVNTSKIIILEKAAEDPNAGKTELKLASFDPLDYTTAEAVCRFNQESTEYRVIFDSRYYLSKYNDDSNEPDWKVKGFKSEQAMFDQMKVDILAGDGPDLIMNGSYFTSSFEGMLFAPLTEDISYDGCFDNVFEASKIAGNIYTVPLSFHVSGIVCDSAFIRERQKGFTYSEYSKFVSSVCNGKDPITYDPINYFLLNYSLKANEYVYAGYVPDFNEKKFKDLATFVNGMVHYSTPAEYTDEVVVNPISDDIHAVLYTFSSTNSYFSFFNARNTDTVVLGLPAEDATGPYISIINSIAVSSASKNKAGCVDFINLLLSDEMQLSYAKSGFSIPVNVNAYNESSMEQLRIYNAARKQYTEMGFSEEDLRNMGYATNAMQKDITNFEDVIRSAEVSYRYDPTVALILREELAAYFKGQKTLGQSIPVINSRVRTYLAENNG